MLSGAHLEICSCAQTADRMSSSTLDSFPADAAHASAAPADAIDDVRTAGASALAAALPPLPPLRVLLLDNFDSYTLNIAHLCASLTRCAPLVRFNTLTAAELRHLIATEHIDCVLVSPGPGTPAHGAQDFGVCADLYSSADFHHVPILGSVELTGWHRRLLRCDR